MLLYFLISATNEIFRVPLNWQLLVQSITTIRPSNNLSEPHFFGHKRFLSTFLHKYGTHIYRSCRDYSSNHWWRETLQTSKWSFQRWNENPPASVIFILGRNIRAPWYKSLGLHCKTMENLGIWGTGKCLQRDFVPRKTFKNLNSPYFPSIRN